MAVYVETIEEFIDSCIYVRMDVSSVKHSWTAVVVVSTVFGVWETNMQTAYLVAWK